MDDEIRDLEAKLKDMPLSEFLDALEREIYRASNLHGFRMVPESGATHVEAMHILEMQVRTRLERQAREPKDYPNLVDRSRELK